ncbi:MAG TPA: bifunctional 4-hydroxy-2-oxoglutarate aldolase/2-dehydro-3-deoxy-phosphogluconate aldolase [Actinomycetota bacterium]|jgi:2-dehydro-3-deoxyphosphogluconate aldolase/(4S)-4-hydroxy-2-oxoglutarate aldolase
MSILATAPVVGIVRSREPGDLVGLVEAIVGGGVPLAEITIDTPGALEAIRRLADAGHTVGVGTVLTADQVAACADAGATFIVSPAVVPAVIEAALARGLDPIPGALSPTELVAATAAGARAVKIFPSAPVGGPAYLRALRGPFPDVDLVATGGIGIEDVRDYLDAGATSVGLADSLVGDVLPSSDDELAAVGRRAARAMELAGAAAPAIREAG